MKNEKKRQETNDYTANESKKLYGTDNECERIPTRKKASLACLAIVARQISKGQSEAWDLAVRGSWELPAGSDLTDRTAISLARHAVGFASLCEASRGHEVM